MLHWLGIRTPEEPAAAAVEEERRPAPRGGTRCLPINVRYKKCTDSAPRDYTVTRMFPVRGSSGETKWHEFEPERFLAMQAKIPAGSVHPVSERVAMSMRAPPPGTHLHPDRNTMLTASNVGAVRGRSTYADRDAASAGFATAAELRIAQATGRAPPVRENEHMRRGKREEPEILALIEAIFGIELIRHRPMGLLVHHSGAVGATPDAICARIPCLIEVKSKYNKTDWAMPDEHYDQVQTQMLATVPRGETTPLIRFVLYVQYVSSPQSGFPLLSARVVKFDPVVAASILQVATAYVERIRQPSAPVAPPESNQAVEDNPARAASNARLRRYMPYAPRKRPVTRMKRL